MPHTNKINGSVFAGSSQIGSERRASSKLAKTGISSTVKLE